MEPENFDEEWWTAILAYEGENEDELIAEYPSNEPSRPAQTVEFDWEVIERIYRQDEVVVVTVHAFNRGGLLVRGSCFQGFVPNSHLVRSSTGNGRQKSSHQYVGQSIRVKIIEFNPEQKRVVLSERAAGAGKGKRSELYHSIWEGMKVSGVVTNVTHFGAFIDLGGVEGLVHVSEISWGRVVNPADHLTIGMQVHVVILKTNTDDGRIALSIKRLQPNPWENIARRYKPGDIVPATITTLAGFGAFARLEEGVEGLIHLSSMPMLEAPDRLSDMLHPGDCVHVRILHLDVSRRRLGLALVQIE